MAETSSGDQAVRSTTTPSGSASAMAGQFGGRLLLRPEEVARLLGVGRTTVYDLLRTGRLGSVRIGASRRIPVRALSRYVDELCAHLA